MGFSQEITDAAVSGLQNGVGFVADKSSTNMHLEELEDPEKFAEEGGKVIAGQEYVSRLSELKAEINHSWHADDRVTSLKLSIKVAKLLMDTSILQCYPTLFPLATDIMDMLRDMVWERIKLKAELAEDGTKLCLITDYGPVLFGACIIWSLHYSFSVIWSLHYCLAGVSYMIDL